MSKLSFHKKRRRIAMDYGILLEVAGWLFQIAIVCFAAFLIVWFFGRKVSVIGDSMSPRLKNGDTVLVNRLVYETRKPRRGETIAFKPNGSKKSYDFVKRVVGLPGETVSYKDGKILIDGEELTEDYQTTEIEELGLLEEPIQLKSDEYFVLGDDRQNSEDSRMANIGNVKKSEITGKVWFVVSPLKHIRFVK